MNILLKNLNNNLLEIIIKKLYINLFKKVLLELKRHHYTYKYYSYRNNFYIYWLNKKNDIICWEYIEDLDYCENNLIYEPKKCNYCYNNPNIFLNYIDLKKKNIEINYCYGCYYGYSKKNKSKIIYIQN